MKVKSLVQKVFILLLAINTWATDPEIGDKTALIVIDMQPYFATRNGVENRQMNKKALEDITKQQTETIKQAMAADMPIVFLEYHGYGDTNDSLKNLVKNYSKAKFIDKTTDGMFDRSNTYKEELTKYLNENEVGKLIVTGANGGACVESSISGALNIGYDVIAYSKGIADFNYYTFIYPYDDYYEFDKKCKKNCKFKEIDELEVLSLEIAKEKVGSKNAKEIKVNNTSRNMIKENQGKNRALPTLEKRTIEK